MRTRQLFLILALLLTAVTGAWADNWDVVYRLTQTTSANWTALSAGSTTGWTIGSAGNTTYYYATGNLSFTNSTVGGSGLTIRGTVYLYIPSGVTVTCTGHNASGTGLTGGGAGVELAAGNTTVATTVKMPTLNTTSIASPARVAAAVTAAAAAVRASAHGAATAAQVVPVVLRNGMRTRVRTRALRALRVVTATLPAAWALSMCIRGGTSAWLPRVAVPDGLPPLEAIAVKTLPKILATSMLRPAGRRRRCRWQQYMEKQCF